MKTNERPQARRAHDIARARLCVRCGEVFLELGDRLVIGRSAACDLQIEDQTVGERHAEIYAVGDLWWVRDLGSEDGIYLDGEMVEAAPLQLPVELRLGHSAQTVTIELSG